MSHPAGQPPVILVRFTRRIERQRRVAGRPVPEWAVCDAIVNGSRAEMPGRGAHGGRVFRFERTYPAGAAQPGANGGFRGRVAVLGELKGRGCLALRLLAPARGGKKSGMVWDF